MAGRNDASWQRAVWTRLPVGGSKAVVHAGRRARRDCGAARRRWWGRVPRWGWPLLAAVVVGVLAGGGMRLWQHARVPADPATLGTLVVTSAPADARIAIDGRDSGRAAPATLARPAGTYHVTLRAPGYAPEEAMVVLGAKQTVVLDRRLWLATARLRRLWAPLPGTTLVSAAFLSDGRLALDVAAPDGGHTVWVEDGAGETTALGPATPAPAVAAAPDGQTVAFLARPHGEGAEETALELASAGAPRARYILPDGAAGGAALVDLRWSPDGRDLLLVETTTVGSSTSWTHLVLLATAGGVPRELARFPAQVVTGSIAWSPDGRQIAFLARTPEGTSLCLVEINRGGVVRTLAPLDPPAGLPAFPPIAWSPDGRSRVYAAPAARSRSGLVLALGSGSALALLAGPSAEAAGRPLATTGWAPAWREDGRILALAPAPRGGGLVLRAIGPSGAATDVASIPLPADAGVAVRWDVARAQAVVAVRAVAAPEFWLVQFR